VRSGVGVVGIVLALAGAALGIISLTAVRWFSDVGPGNSGKFPNIHNLIKLLHTDATGIGKAYFNWLAWTLVIAAAALALLANLPTPASSGLRMLGALVGLAGIGLTFWGIDFAHGESYSQFLKHARIGFYLMLGAFLLTTIGSLIGPRRVRT
jgi:hypothetical protein